MAGLLLERVVVLPVILRTKYLVIYNYNVLTYKIPDWLIPFSGSIFDHILHIVSLIAGAQIGFFPEKGITNCHAFDGHSD